MQYKSWLWSRVKFNFVENMSDSEAKANANDNAEPKEAKLDIR